MRFSGSAVTMTPGHRNAHQRPSTVQVVEKSRPQQIGTLRRTQAAFAIDFIDVFPPEKSLRSGLTAYAVISPEPNSFWPPSSAD
jgi:hypothetical protein